MAEGGCNLTTKNAGRKILGVFCLPRATGTYAEFVGEGLLQEVGHAQMSMVEG